MALTLTLTDPTTKEKLSLSEFIVDLNGTFDSALGKKHNDRYYCDDEKTVLWPIKFTLTARGTMDSTKEGRLRVDVTASYTLERGKAEPENRGGYGIKLRREATNQDMGGYVLHDKIRAMVQAKELALIAPAKTALLTSIAKAKKEEEVASASHSARAQVAGTVIQTIKKPA